MRIDWFFASLLCVEVPVVLLAAAAKPMGAIAQAAMTAFTILGFLFLAAWSGGDNFEHATYYQFVVDTTGWDMSKRLSETWGNLFFGNIDFKFGTWRGAQHFLWATCFAVGFGVLPLLSQVLWSQPRALKTFERPEARFLGGLLALVILTYQSYTRYGDTIVADVALQFCLSLLTLLECLAFVACLGLALGKNQFLQQRLAFEARDKNDEPRGVWDVLQPFWTELSARHSADDPSKAPHLTAFMSYKAGMTHIVREVDRPGSKLHKKEIVEPVTVLESPPMVVVGFVGYVETPRGLRALTSVWAGHLSEECKRRFYKTWKGRKHKAFTKYEKRWSEASKEGTPMQAEVERAKKYCQVIRAICHTQVRKVKIGQKKAHIKEIQVNGGATEAKVDFVMNLFEQEVKIADCFSQDEVIDLVGTTKGKGFNGVVTRWGVTRLVRKSHRGLRK
ncbi:unnamed protein product, partial [Effrenium voratum]